MKKSLFKISIVICTLLALSACASNSEKDNDTYIPTTTETTTEKTINNFHTEQVQVYEPAQSTSSATASTENAPMPSNMETLPVPSAQTPPTAPLEQTEIITTTEKTYEKTGEMAFSDSADNRYISAISKKYGVDARLLVALYTVPENDSNIVLQFDGTTDSNGKLIRNKDTLVAIYSINKNLESKRASEDRNLNEYSYGEMKVMFMSVTSYIMPEFEAELNG